MELDDVATRWYHGSCHVGGDKRNNVREWHYETGRFLLVTPI